MVAKACVGDHIHMDCLQCYALALVKVPLSGITGKSKPHGVLYMIFHIVPCQSRVSYCFV